MKYSTIAKWPSFYSNTEKPCFFAHTDCINRPYTDKLVINHRNCVAPMPYSLLRPKKIHVWIWQLQGPYKLDSHKWHKIEWMVKCPKKILRIAKIQIEHFDYNKIRANRSPLKAIFRLKWQRFRKLTIKVRKKSKDKIGVLGYRRRVVWCELLDK